MSSARQGTHRHSFLLESDALPLLLRHPGLLLNVTAIAICQLLKTSKAMRAAIMQHCRGMLQVTLGVTSKKQVDQLMEWLASYTCLLGALVLQSVDEYSEEPELRHHLDARLLETLQQLRLQHGVSALKRFVNQLAGKQAGAVLQNLSSGSLTELALRGSSRTIPLSIRDSNLPAFTNLHSLTLEWFQPSEADFLAGAMSALANLNELDYTGPVYTEQLPQLQQGLPRSITSLTLWLFRPGPDTLSTPMPVQYQLQHLQQLKYLRVKELSGGSCLPQQLQELCCWDCPDMQALRPCLQLRDLELTYSTTSSAANWRRLSDLTSLTSIGLNLRGTAADETAQAFTLRPLRSALQTLTISPAHDATIQAATLQSLQRLTALTSLTLMVCRPLPGSPGELGAILQQLTALQQVEIYPPDHHLSLFEPVLQPLPAPPLGTLQAISQLIAYMSSGQTSAAAFEALTALPTLEQAVHQVMLVAEGVPWGGLTASILAQPLAVNEVHDFVQQMHDSPMQPLETSQPQDLLPLVEAIAGLPLLDSLKLKGSGLDASSVEPLTGVTQLTRLTMSGADFDDTALVKLVYALSNLQRLSLSCSEEITDAALLVIGKVLSQLTELELTDCTKVTNKGIAYLTGLRHLEMLEAIDAPLIRQLEVDRVLRFIAAQQ